MYDDHDDFRDEQEDGGFGVTDDGAGGEDEWGAEDGGAGAADEWQTGAAAREEAVPAEFDEELRGILAIEHREQKRVAYGAYARAAIRSEDAERALAVLAATRHPVIQNNIDLKWWTELYAEELLGFFTTLGQDAAPRLSSFFAAVCEAFLAPSPAGRQGLLARLVLAQLREQQGELEEAAQEFAQVGEADAGLLESERALVYVRLTSLHLRLGQLAVAEMWSNRARAKDTREHMAEAQERAFARCCVELDELQRRFIAASSGYYKLDMLEKAVACITLAYLDPKVSDARMENARVRLLSRLASDDRVLRSALGHVMRLLAGERLLRAEREALLPFVAPQHLQPQDEEDGGLSVFDAAIVEHNIFALSGLFRNISLDELGSLLGVTAARVEGVAMRMIVDGRLSGSLDQLQERLFFISADSVIQERDSKIAASCALLRAASAIISDKYPEN